MTFPHSYAVTDDSMMINDDVIMRSDFMVLRNMLFLMDVKYECRRPSPHPHTHTGMHACSRSPVSKVMHIILLITYIKNIGKRSAYSYLMIPGIFAAARLLSFVS